MRLRDARLAADTVWRLRLASRPMFRVLASMALVFLAIGGCSLGALMIFLIGPPFWRELVGPAWGAPAAIAAYGIVIWAASRLMRLADWLLQASW